MYPLTLHVVLIVVYCVGFNEVMSALERCCVHFAGIASDVLHVSCLICAIQIEPKNSRVQYEETQ